MASRTVKLKDIRTATEASIRAVLGKRFVSRPGVLVGLWIDKGKSANCHLNPRRGCGKASVGHFWHQSCARHSASERRRTRGVHPA
jgi:hypothetical protein